MLVFSIQNVKGFMSMLLKNDTFDTFEVRHVQVQTFTNFEISGILDKDYYTEDEQLQRIRNYCLWSELRPIVFHLIKGNKLPKTIKLIFSLPNDIMESVSDKASALFLNITFESGQINCVTGSSQKDFSLDKSVEYIWDEYIENLFKKLEISVTEL